MGRAEELGEFGVSVQSSFKVASGLFLFHVISV